MTWTAVVSQPPSLSVSRLHRRARKPKRREVRRSDGCAVGHVLVDGLFGFWHGKPPRTPSSSRTRVCRLMLILRLRLRTERRLSAASWHRRRRVDRVLEIVDAVRKRNRDPFCRLDRRTREVGYEIVVVVSGSIPKPSGLVDVDHKGGRKYGGAFPFGQVQRLCGPSYEICMGTWSSRCVLSEDIENFCERRFERRMGGLHGVLQGHPRAVPIKVIVVEAARVEQAASVVEVTAAAATSSSTSIQRASVTTARAPSFQHAARNHPSSSRDRTDQPASRTWKPRSQGIPRPNVASMRRNRS